MGCSRVTSANGELAISSTTDEESALRLAYGYRVAETMTKAVRLTRI